jgi:RimJ/RimL family protein N-acetyltransferase
MRGVILAAAFQRRDAGIEQPFVILDHGSGELAGSTRYLDIQPLHRGVEIGWTWIAPAYQRTAVNTHAKFLLMRHAFETLGAIRVSLKTDSRNERSQRAIERIGAKREGVLRNHYIMPDGYYRDSVYYSVIDTEWPMVKERLDAMMNVARSSA